MIDTTSRNARLFPWCLGALTASIVATQPAFAQQPTSAQAGAIRSACRADCQANCAGVPTGVPGGAGLSRAERARARRPAASRRSPPSAAPRRHRPPRRRARRPPHRPLGANTPSFAANTNWDVFSDANTKTFYLLNNGGWLAAPDAKGPWMPAGKLPPSFAALPTTAISRTSGNRSRAARLARAMRRRCSCRRHPRRSSSPAARRNLSRYSARRCSTSPIPTRRCSATRAAASTTSCPAAGSTPGPWTARGRSPPRACRRTSRAFRPTVRAASCWRRCRARRCSTR